MSDPETEFPPLTKDEALDILRQSAWTDYGVNDDIRHACLEFEKREDVPDELVAAAVLLADFAQVHAEAKVHRLGSFTGASVDLAGVLDDVRDGRGVRWQRTMHGVALTYQEADGAVWAIDSIRRDLLPAAPSVDQVTQ